jgi:tetratricopeptide (TPR) repeat protein
MNMNCKKAEEYLVEYLYQELPAKKTLEIEKHLGECATCAKTLESWRAIHRGYQRSAEEPQVAPYFKQKILAAAEDELLRKPSWSDRLLFGLKIATVPIAIFVVLIVFNQAKNKAPEMAMKNERAEQHAPATVSEKETRQQEAAPQAKQQLQGYRDRTESYSYDKLKAAPPADEEKRLKDYKENAKKESDALERSDLDQPTPSPAAPPAASEPAPQQEEQSYGGAKPDQREIAQAPSAQKGAAISPVSKTTNESWNQVQSSLENNDLKGAQKNAQDAISQDSYRSLAGQFHQEGIVSQNKGEYGKAIFSYTQVQSNYRDYPELDDVLLRLGDSYAQIGEFGKAVKAYQQVSPAKQKMAQQRIQQLQKKREAQEQLRSLGYVDSNKQN